MNNKKDTIRGWAFGEDRTIACANVDGNYYAVDGTCPRCAFDLFKGKLLTDTEVWGPDPTVACPTCGSTYSMKTGKNGPDYKAKGKSRLFVLLYDSCILYEVSVILILRLTCYCFI